MQLTYLVMGGGTADPCFLGAGGFYPSDPCNPGPAWGWWEGYEDPCDPETWYYYEAPLAEWDWFEDPQDTWADTGEFWAEGELQSQQTLEDNWIHEVWAFTLDLNPDYEWIEFGYVADTGILLDQIVIETLCYVPEPATMVLLGLGSLMMIRRKKK